MNCRACGAASLDTVFAMDPMPLAGAFAETQQEALDMPRYPLEWRQCQRCGLVNVWPDIPDAEIYTNYSYRASDVPALVRHHQDFAKWLVERFPNTRALLEIGGNDGVLLRNLPEAWGLLNVDPSDVAREQRGDWGLRNEPFPCDLGGQMFDLIVSSNAFAHFTDIGGALDGVAKYLAPDGWFIVEVHDLEATLRSGQWDTIYHEHKVEWSLLSLAMAGASHGLELEAFGTGRLHGGIIRAGFRKGTRQETLAPPLDCEALRNAYANRKPTGATAAYGAAARATVYLNQVPEPVRYVVDGSPRRQWRWVPGIGIPVWPPGMFDLNHPDRTLITAWNHAEDIKAAHPDYAGEWVTAW